jgi:RNA polymerase sigma factor (sigma-70 family)
MTPEQRCDRLASLLDEHGPALALFASQWTDAPDDCLQEALIRLARQYPWPDNPAAWLYRVVRNQAINQARSGERRRWHEGVAARLRRSSPCEPGDAIDATALGEAVERLAAGHREVLVARIWGRLTLEQIAEVLSISKSSVHRRYEAALAALRKQLLVNHSE